MKKNKFDRFGVNVALILLLVSTLIALPTKRLGFLQKPSTLEYILFDANEIWCYTGNNGEIVTSSVTGNSGLYWPGGTDRTAVFQSGLWFVGMVNGEVRSAASEYASEFQPGKIIYDQATKVGYADNSSLARYQVWSINKGDSPDPASPNYNREYALWPVSDGAPAHDGEYFTDANSNGIYDDGEVFEDYNRDAVYNGPDSLLVEGEDPPLLIGDQVHWSVFNDYDATVHAALWSTQPLGIEIQSTVFGFDRADPLGDVMFIKWLIINKSGQTITDAYLSMWSDPDVGQANDDYVGCDTNLSVGYCYNGNAVDQDYGATVPCVGYDFFQGPIVPSVGDTALVSGKLIPDFRNLPMTSFIKYTNGGTVQDPETAEEAYNFMKGFKAKGELWYDLDGNVVKFLYPGDPMTRSGWTEYDDDTPQDRRFLMSSGPFSMVTWVDSNGDGYPQVGEPGVQEIVGAIVIAAGTTNLNAISAMKYFDAYAQNAYDAQFDLPSPPSPTVATNELDKQIILTWQEGADQIENYSKLGYNFEGYNIYQGQSSTGPWTRITTYDVDNALTIIIDKLFDVETGLILESPVQFGSDAGPKRYIDITTDKLNGNAKLINGRVYYYAVTAYAYNPDAAPKVIESSMKPFSVRPHEPALGQKLLTATGDYLTVEHADGVSETVVQSEVINPLQLSGAEYAVVFSYDSTTSQGSWSLVRKDENGLVVDSLIKKNTTLDGYTSEMMEGFKVSVKDVAFNPPVVNKSWEMTKNVIPTLVDSADYISADIYQSGVDTTAIINGDTVMVDSICGLGKYWATWEKVTFSGVAWFRLKRTVLHEVSIQGWASNLGGNNGLAAGVGKFGDKTNNKGIQDIVRLRSDIELRFTETGQNAIFWPKNKNFKMANATLGHVPFEVWDIERNIQLCVGIADQDNDTTIYEETTNQMDADWIVTIHKDYSEGTNSTTILPILASECTSTGNLNDYTGWLFYMSASSIFSVGDTLRMNFLNPVETGVDEFTFVATELQTDLSKKEKQAQLKKINIFPNPYFGFNVEETQPIARFVTITHLPEQGAVIRIFSLGGQLITKIDHSNSDYTGTTFERWDLRNKYGIPVASGIYIVHIDVKDVGEKILKIAVFQPEERLDVY